MRKKHATNGIALADLSVVGGVAFTRTLATNEATFVSDATVSLNRQRQSLELHAGGTKVIDLPNPNETTPVTGDASVGDLESRLFVYV